MDGSELFLDGYEANETVFHSVVNSTEYEIESYKGEHEKEYCVYEVKNGVRDGTAELFDDGMVKMRWRMKNGARDGKYVLFDKGVVVREGRWMDIGNSEERVIDNSKVELSMVIRKDGEVVYQGGYGEMMQRKGLGMEYENGVLKQFGEWEDDELVELKQRFVNEYEMIEYGKGSNQNLFSHRPIYIGGYIFDEASGLMKRSGPGRVMNKLTGVCKYESEWDNGVEKKDKRVVLYDGWYCDHDPGQSTREAITKATLETVVSPLSLLSGPLRIEEVKTGNRVFNDASMEKLQLSSLPNLKRLEIGNDCFGSTRLFDLQDLSELQTVTIGKRSFTLSRSRPSTKREDGLCRLTNCPKLTSFQVDMSSFLDYNTLSLNDLPSLQQLQLGSDCFYGADSFLLKGEVHDCSSPFRPFSFTVY